MFYQSDSQIRLHSPFYDTKSIHNWIYDAFIYLFPAFLSRWDTKQLLDLLQFSHSSSVRKPGWAQGHPKIFHARGGDSNPWTTFTEQQYCTYKLRSVGRKWLPVRVNLLRSRVPTNLTIRKTWTILSVKLHLALCGTNTLLWLLQEKCMNLGSPSNALCFSKLYT